MNCSVNDQFGILEGTKVAKLQSCKVAKTKRYDNIFDCDISSRFMVTICDLEHSLKHRGYGGFQ